jgi:hypothetical protein
MSRGIAANGKVLLLICESRKKIPPTEILGFRAEKLPNRI